MSKVERQHLLTASQMAHFVTYGYLQLDELVPPEHNEAVLEDEKRMPDAGYHFWQRSEAVRAVFDLPQVKGVVQSFVGVDPAYDHSYLHIVGPRRLKAQEWHADSVIDTRPFAFDIQAFYFTHDAPAEMGPTLILPGSHLRRVNTSSIARYKNIVGQRQLAAKAGTIVFMHQAIWHCAQPNHTDQTRYVFKLRLHPRQQQRNLFNTEGYQDPEVTSIIERGYLPWQGNEARLEHIMRARFWRYVTGDDLVDVSFEKALTRMGLE